MKATALIRFGRVLPVVLVALALVATTVLAAASARKATDTKVHVLSPQERDLDSKGLHEGKKFEPGTAVKSTEAGGSGPLYSWLDSTEPGGPTYSWIDITATGTATGLADDGETDAVISFSFPFYGVGYTDARIGNNGGIALGAPGTGNLNAGNDCPLPSADDADPKIYPFWDDMDTETGDVYYENQASCAHPDCGGACFVVEWYDRPHFNGIGGATFEAILCDDGSLIYQYQDLDFGDPTVDYGASATVGIEDEGQNATYYLEAFCNSAVLTDTYAVRFTPGVGAGINLAKTVGTDPNVCASDTTIAVLPGTDVTYCYDLTNTGTVTLSMHDLFDSELADILIGFPFDLGPAASVFVTSTVNLSATTINTATWTAYNPGPSDVVSATASATVNMLTSAPPSFCEGFETGTLPPFMYAETTHAPPANARVEVTTAFPNTGSYGVDIDTDCDGCGGSTTQAVVMAVDLAAASNPLLDFWVHEHGDENNPEDGVFISDDGGTSWALVQSLNNLPSSYQNFQIDLATAASGAGMSLVDGFLIKFQSLDNFSIPTDGYTFDDICVTDYPQPVFTLAKTVGADPNECAPSDNISIPSGADATYCYYMDNTGPITVNLHTVVDSELGTLLGPDFPATVAPGAAAWFTFTTPISSTVVNTATWEASIIGGPSGVMTDTAQVVVNTDDPLVCNGTLVLFEGGPPLDWTVVDNEGSGVVWTTTGAGGYPGNCGEANYTNGSGNAACVSSDVFGSAEVDTELWSTPFDTTGQFIVQLSYTANYQNLANQDFLDVDVSTNGGGSWTNVLSWNEDHGTFRDTPGEDVVLDISPVAANQPSVIVRWRYYEPTTPDFNWYAEIDNAVVTCDIPVELEKFTIE